MDIQFIGPSGLKLFLALMAIDKRQKFKCAVKAKNKI